MANILYIHQYLHQLQWPIGFAYRMFLPKKRWVAKIAILVILLIIITSLFTDNFLGYAFLARKIPDYEYSNMITSTGNTVVWVGIDNYSNDKSKIKWKIFLFTLDEDGLLDIPYVIGGYVKTGDPFPTTNPSSFLIVLPQAPLFTCYPQFVSLINMNHTANDLVEDYYQASSQFGPDIDQKLIVIGVITLMMAYTIIRYLNSNKNIKFS